MSCQDNSALFPLLRYLSNHSPHEPPRFRIHSRRWFI